MAIVTFQTSDHELRKEQKPITFRVSNGSGHVGKLVISKGGLRWYRGKSSKRHRHLTWERFAKRIREIARSTS